MQLWLALLLAFVSLSAEVNGIYSHTQPKAAALSEGEGEPLEEVGSGHRSDSCLKFLAVMPVRTVLSQAPSVPALPTQSSKLALHLAEEEAGCLRTLRYRSV